MAQQNRLNSKSELNRKTLRVTKSHFIAAVCLTLTTVLAAAFAVAETPQASPKEKIVAAGTLKLAGRRMSCGRTPTLMSHTFWDYGGAKKGMIILNPSKLNGLSDAVRLYVYAHECGHQVYGPRETRADCYAVERGKREGWLDQSGMDEVCTFISAHPGDWVHPPGPKRCEIMRACYAKAKPPRASR